MTILDASLKLYGWFEQHDTVVVETDFKKIVLISENETEDKAIFIAALKDLERQQMIVAEESDGIQYWILKQPFRSYEQDVKIGAPVSQAIAEEINLFCEKIQDDTDKCDITSITEKDIMNLIYINQHYKALAGQNDLTGGDVGGML